MKKIFKEEELNKSKIEIEEKESKNEQMIDIVRKK